MACAGAPAVGLAGTAPAAAAAAAAAAVARGHLARWKGPNAAGAAAGRLSCVGEGDVGAGDVVAAAAAAAGGGG